MPIGPSTYSCTIAGNGLRMASIIASCITMTPPPEYFIAVIGGRSIRTGPTLDGFWPSRICTSVGNGAEGW
jgi:hypothetical protein